ncbi:DNA repair and recombination protein RAD52-like isoform X2 [Maniola jurtina]|uniref:DNA repair and recombination protein RAD52-like isoform X2 n=1 Tax=Maniola jurtina TaxID=191418 RepID=UPI001E688A7A|nr:DNA repair and recombination protein RAD52-like isoform X2 [Maniola jurtina]
MQRKPGFPVANCNIRIPDSTAPSEGVEEEEPPQRRQQLINYGHSQWGFNNWSWAVTKQDLDFVEISNGKYTAGVVSFVSVSVKGLGIHRENVGYATSTAPHKGAAIHNSRKCAVTNALRETLLSFGGTVATDLLELLEANRNDTPHQNQNQTPNQNPVKNQNHVSSDPIHENNQNIANTTANKVTEKSVSKVKKDEVPGAAKLPTGPLKNMVQPVAKAHPMPANVPANVPPNVPPNVANRPQPTANAPRHPPLAPAPPTLRPNSNEVRLEDMSEEDARAERKRRQRQAQEEFRLKQLMKQKDMDDNQEMNKDSFDTVLMAIPSQDIVIGETGNTAVVASAKRKSPASDSGAAKRRTVTKLDTIEK